MKILSLLIGLIGLGMAGFLIVQEGPTLVLKTFADAGWGVLLANLAHLPHMMLAGRGWQVLWPPQRRPRLTLLFWVLWVREAVNSLLPVARVGGEVVAVAMLRRSGLPLSSSVGTLVVETTLSIAATLLLVLVSLFLLAARVPSHGQWLQWTLGLMVAAAVLAALIGVQRLGAFRLSSRLLNMLGGSQKLVASGRRLDRAVWVFYRDPWRVTSCTAWSFLSWCVGAVEIWLAMLFLNHPISFADAFILEGMVLAIGAAAFFVPGTLGVQEAAFLLFGQMLGVPGHLCLSLALIRRCRDLLVMAPALLVWQVQEGHSLLAGLRKRPPET